LRNIGEEIFNINSEEAFNELALTIFSLQYEKNEVYRRWVQLLNIRVETVQAVEQIPCLPIEFFKSQQVLSGPMGDNAKVFRSSATTGQVPSTHHVTDLALYEKSFLRAFEMFYGKPDEYCILALLPNYLDRDDSSLVYMFHHLIKASNHPLSGFFNKNEEALLQTIQKLKNSKGRVLLLGVSYALMDLSQKVKLNEQFIVMETGGMKGKRKELLKAELHAYLKKGFGLEEIHSEYGMTELLSQAYSKGAGQFTTPPWMRVLIREVTDPLSLNKNGKTGGVNVIDLANLNSCAFIATKDLGKWTKEGGLELMGRYDNSDVRGCNLMLDGQ
jgi:phenylacetate-coenzyme A ligase PaaK-like adenylate-forming protein